MEDSAGILFDGINSRQDPGCSWKERDRGDRGIRESEQLRGVERSTGGKPLSPSLSPLSTCASFKQESKSGRVKPGR